MIDKLNTEQIEELMHQQILGHLACHADGQTYIIPISYAYDGKYVYCHALDGKKIGMMRKNPKVCFQVEDMKDMGNWKSVVTWGQYEELANGKEKEEAIQLLLKRPLPIISSMTTHLGKDWPFQNTDIKDIPGIVFRLRIDEKTGRFESSGASPAFPG